MELNAYQMDLLQELINMGVGRAAGSLNQLVRVHVVLSVPYISLISPEDCTAYTSSFSKDHLAAVKLGFNGDFSGTAVLVFPTESAEKLVSIVIGEETMAFDEDSLRIGALQEVGNIVLNGVMGTITNVLNQSVDYFPPDFIEGSFDSVFSQIEEGEPTMFLIVKTHFELEETLIEGDVIILFRMHSFDALLLAMDRISSHEGAAAHAN